MFVIQVELEKKEIASGDWNKTQNVKYFFRGKLHSTLTKKQALEKISDSTKNGYKVITGVLVNGKNYLLVIASSK